MRSGWGRSLVIAVAATTLGASCGHSGASTSQVSPTPSPTNGTSGTSTTTEAGPRSGSAANAASPRPTATRAGAQGSGGNAPAPPGSANIVATDATGGPGNLARDLLQGQPASVDVLELLSQSGAEPDSAAMSRARGKLASASGKTVNMPQGQLDGAQRDWTDASLRQLADTATKHQQGGGQAVVHLLFLHGTYNGDTSVLGITVRADVIAVFQDQIAASATFVASARTLVEAVTTHEMGHALGLVDLVLRTGREDPAHPGHSRSQKSVMYWAIDSDLFSQIISGPPPVDFDSADLADLATIRRGS